MKHFFKSRPILMFVSITAILLLDSMNLLAVEDSKDVGKQQEFISQAQIGRKITVKVSDSYGPIIGANVIVKGSTNGGITDVDGNVVLSGVSQGETVVVSFIGYVTQEIVVGTSSIITVKLAEDAEILDEVVVIGYGAVKKNDLTGAITQIDPTKKEEHFSANATDLLRNTVAGMNIPFSTSAKGDINTSNILIRGTNSIKASNGPLIVLDGIIWEGDLADISSSDIARIDVMKDASSAAVYGSFIIKN